MESTLYLNSQHSPYAAFGDEAALVRLDGDAPGLHPIHAHVQPALDHLLAQSRLLGAKRIEHPARTRMVEQAVACEQTVRLAQWFVDGRFPSDKREGRQMREALEITCARNEHFSAPDCAVRSVPRPVERDADDVLENLDTDLLRENSDFIMALLKSV